MDNLNEKNLKKSLASGLKSVYYVVGNELFLLDSCVRSITKACGGDVQRFDAAVLDIFELQAALITVPFFVDGCKLVLIDEFKAEKLGDKKLEEIAALFAQLPDFVCVVCRAYYDDKRFSVGKKCLQAVSAAANSAVVELHVKSGSELENLLQAIAARLGCELDASAGRELIGLCGDDLNLLSREIEKAAAHAAYGRVTLNDVRAVSVRTMEANVFDIMRSIARRDGAGAQRKLCELLDERREPLAVSAALNSSLVNMYRCRLAKDSGKSQQWLNDTFSYKKNDRALGVAYDQCSRYSVAQLESAMALLCRLDEQMKSSAADNRILLETALAELLAVLGCAP